MLERLFLCHPRSIGETYLQHQRHAFSFGLSMLGGAMACFVHGFVPALFLTTGSRTVARLFHRMLKDRLSPEQLALIGTWEI
jgi:hypothetical protein